MSDSVLFSSFKLGSMPLSNRIVMAPMTRCRAGEGNVPTAQMAVYYGQRASAGLIISEATQVAPEGQGYIHTPGIHSKEQTEGWKQITSAVHAKGGKIILQLWHVGRISHSLYQPGGKLPVAPSAIAAPGDVYTPQGMKPFETPRALEAAEIPGIVQQYVMGAKNAIAAGFDGVEVHGANGYLLDQFLQTGSNQRTDQYGGSVENRARFLLDVTAAVVAAVGADRVGVRLSPNGTFNGMSDANPRETFSYVVSALDKMGIAYVHFRTGTAADEKHGRTPVAMSVFRPLFKRAVILNDGFTKEKAEAALADGAADLVAFGMPFIANPDLPKRLQTNASLARADIDLLYTGGEKGYTDYPALN
jgi:N-ethylmaleimide reductase